MTYQIMAVIILLAFYGCYYVKMLNQHRKGIQTNQIGKSKEGLVKKIEMTMKVATILVVIVEGISILLNATYAPAFVRNVGIVMGVLGVMVFITSVITMRDSWRAGVSKAEKTELVTEGIYRISRNPAFLGFDLIYIGIALMFLNPGHVLATVFAMVTLHLQVVKVEEKFLAETFGDAYLAYQGKVNRYFGRKVR